MHYRRARVEGGTYFFTVNLANRRSDLLVKNIDALRSSVRLVRKRHPFEIIAMVVLPDHLHAIWKLPSGDSDFPTRWSLIKSGFSRSLSKTGITDDIREKRRERGVWQYRYWEHLIRDDNDLSRHVDYIHYNPVKHGHSFRAADWSYSSIHKYIKSGMISKEWGAGNIELSGSFGE